MNLKSTLSSIGLVVVGLVVLIVLFMSWMDVDPGEEGFAYRPYSGGVDIESSYTEGTYFIPPWNDIITYNILQQSKSYESTVMDVNGTDISVEVAVNFSVEKGNAAKLHLRHGVGYIQFIDDKVKGAIKDVVGRYTYQEVYSSKREALEGEIEEILIADFKGNFIVFHYVEIADVNLPENIATEITNKETQKQKNLTAEQKKQEQEYLAAAKIATAKGDSAKTIIRATAEAQSIKIKQEQLRSSSQYIEYLKAQRWDGKMPQVVGSGGGLIIDLKK
jgi:regulator of protease activity HflC (stomatin/prohibitin superfamily)